jgi:hypothetical protein
MATGYIDLVIPMMSMSATASNDYIECVIPMMTFDATGHSGEVLTGDMRVPMMTMAGSISAEVMLRGDIEIPMMTMSATVLTGNVLSADMTVPMMAMQMAGPNSIEMAVPMMAMAGSILTGNMLRMAPTVPMMTMVGTITSQNLLSAAWTIPMPTMSASILSGAVARADLTMPMMTMSADVYTGTLSTVALVVPMMTMAGNIIQDNTLTIALVVPMMTMAVIGHTARGASDGAYAMQMRNSGLTHFSNFAFNSMAKINGAYVLANSSGLYVLGGDLDDTALIAASVRMGLTDMGAEELKRAVAAYVAYQTDGDLTLTVTTDDGETYEYDLEQRPNRDAPHNNRVKLGRGLKGRYWQTGFSNQAGCDFEFDSVDLRTDKLSRRIG